MKMETTAMPIRLYFDSIPFNSSLWIAIRQFYFKMPFSGFPELKNEMSIQYLAHVYTGIS